MTTRSALRFSCRCRHENRSRSRYARPKNMAMTANLPKSRAAKRFQRTRNSDIIPFLAWLTPREVSTKQPIAYRPRRKSTAKTPLPPGRRGFKNASVYPAGPWGRSRCDGSWAASPVQEDGIDPTIGRGGEPRQVLVAPMALPIVVQPDRPGPGTALVRRAAQEDIPVAVSRVVPGREHLPGGRLGGMRQRLMSIA